jgi:hypothetical protein
VAGLCGAWPIVSMNQVPLGGHINAVMCDEKGVFALRRNDNWLRVFAKCWKFLKLRLGVCEIEHCDWLVLGSEQNESFDNIVYE